MKIQVITFFVFLLFWLLVFGILNRIIVKRLSYSIEKRYLHFRLILAGALAALIASSPLVSSFSLLLVDKIINLPFLANFFTKVLPNRAYELVYMVLCNIGLNLLYTLGFVIVFWLTRLIFKGKEKYIEYEHCVGSERIVHFPWAIVNRFYTESGGRASLNGKGYSLGICVKGIKWVFAFLWIAGLSVLYYSILWGKEEWNEAALTVSKAVYLLPMVAFFLIEQVQLFLEGSEDNSGGSFGTADIHEKLIGDMDALLNRYRAIFSESGILLHSEIGPKYAVTRQGLASNDVGNKQLEDCVQPEIFLVISNQLRQSGVNENYSYQNAIRSLLNGHAIRVRDRVDGEFTIYLCAYLNYFLAQGRSAIVLCKDKAEAEQIRTVLEENVEKLDGIAGIWNICDVGGLPTTNNIGILICTHEELLTVDFNSAYELLAADMMCAVIPNCSATMALDWIHLERLFGKLHSFPNLCQYAFISEDESESLSNKIKAFLPSGVELDAYSNDSRVQNTNVMIWKEESVYRPQQTLDIGNTASPFLGTALPLALVAAKYDLPQVNIIPDPARGDDYFFGGARVGNEKAIINYLGRNIDLNSIIRYSSKDAMQPYNLKVIGIYDCEFNFFKALWKWFKYAGKDGTLVHVVSPFYMLREFFAANMNGKSLLYSGNIYDSLLPNEKTAKRTKLASLLATLADEGMTEDELMDMSKRLEWDYPDAASLLKDAVLTVLSEKEFHSVQEHFSFTREKFFAGSAEGFVQRVRIKLADTYMIEKQKKQIRAARMTFLSKHKEYNELPVLSGNLWNYYLPKQIVAYNGSYYSVGSVDSTEGIVSMLPTSPVSIPDYFTLCDYTLRDYRIVDNCVDNPLLDCNLCVADCTKIIYGYIATNKGNVFSKESKPVINILNDASAAYPKVSLHNVPILEINLLRKSFSSDEIADKAALLLCVLLNGAFKTLFPRTYQNIAAVPDLPIDNELIEQVLNCKSDEYPEEDLVRASIPRIDAGCADRDGEYARIYIIEFSCIEYGMAWTVYEKLDTVLNTVYDYLDWYIASNRSPEDGGPAESDRFIRGSYLHFGLDHIPSVFAPEALRTVLSDLLGRTDPETVIVPDSEEALAVSPGPTAVCSFCNREIIFAWQLSDGRCMCAHCHDHQKTTKEEIKVLFMETKRMLEKHYHIGFRKDIHVRFQSADAIRAAAGGAVGARIVGFYNHGRRQLWIESKGPSVAMESTIIHELTHAWQHDNLPLKELARVFPKRLRDKRMLLLLEGHAVFVEIEAMREKGDVEYAAQLKNSYLSGSDEYRQGYLLISARFGAMSDLGSVNAFEKMKILVDKIIEDRGASITWPTGY